MNAECHSSDYLVSFACMHTYANNHTYFYMQSAYEYIRNYAGKK